MNLELKGYKESDMRVREILTLLALNRVNIQEAYVVSIDSSCCCHWTNGPHGVLTGQTIFHVSTYTDGTSYVSVMNPCEKHAHMYYDWIEL